MVPKESVEEFLFLRSFSHQRRLPIDQLLRVHDELYQLAQVITKEYYPDLADELTTARREFMKLLKEYRASICGNVVATRAKKAKAERWTDHQVTPEVTRDPAVAGLIVPRALAKRLVRLHKDQISAITDLIARSRGKSGQ